MRTRMWPMRRHIARDTARTPLTLRTVPNVPAPLAPFGRIKRQEVAHPRSSRQSFATSTISSSKGSLSSPSTISSAGKAAADLVGLVAMRMEEERAGIGRRELVGEGLAGLDRLLRDEWHAIHGIGHADAVPVDGRMLGKVIAERGRARGRRG